MILALLVPATLLLCEDTALNALRPVTAKAKTVLSGESLVSVRDTETILAIS